MTQDQVMALARQLLPILGTLMTVLGFKSATAQATVDLILQIIGPIFVLGSVIWSFIANTRASIMASAAKPVAQEHQLLRSSFRDRSVILPHRCQRM
jgi:hypothetical protein